MNASSLFNKLFLPTVDNGVRICLLVIMAWTIVEIWISVGIGMLDSPFYSFGPSESMVLPFTKIVINTWVSWWALMFHTGVSAFINAATDDMIFPWLSSVALNKSVALPSDPLQTWASVNIFWTLKELNGMFFFFTAMSQFDVLLCASLCRVIAGMLSAYIAIWHRKVAVPYSSSSSRRGLAMYSNAFKISADDVEFDAFDFNPSLTHVPSSSAIMTND